MLLRPSWGEPKLHQLDFFGAVAGDDGGMVAVADVGVGLPGFVGLDIEPLFNGLDGGDGDVSAAHGREIEG